MSPKEFDNGLPVTIILASGVKRNWKCFHGYHCFCCFACEKIIYLLSVSPVSSAVVFIAGDMKYVKERFQEIIYQKDSEEGLKLGFSSNVYVIPKQIEKSDLSRKHRILAFYFTSLT